MHNDRDMDENSSILSTGKDTLTLTIPGLIITIFMCQDY